MPKPTGVFTSASFCKMPSVEIMTAKLMVGLQSGGGYVDGPLLKIWFGMKVSIGVHNNVRLSGRN
jgi:hypothetical protein